MKNVVILHGWPGQDSTILSPSHSHWIPWLKEQLDLNGITAETPDMPDANKPDYEKWKSAFEQFVLTEETVLVGHSCGAGFLVRWLSEHPVTVAKVFLVAPWIDPDGILDNSFFDFSINSNLTKNTKKGVTIFSSMNDDSDVQRSVAIILERLPDAELQGFINAGHFCTQDGYPTFPVLLEEILGVYE